MSAEDQSEFDDTPDTFGQKISFISRIILGSVVIFILMFVAEFAINLYDIATDSRTSVNGIATQNEPVAGNVLRISHVMSFRSTDFSVSFQAKHVSRIQTTKLENGINGSAHITLSGPDGEIMSWDIPVVLKAAVPVRVPSVEMASGNTIASDLGVEIGVRYNISCFLDPYNPEAGKAIKQFHSTEFLKGEKLDIVIAFADALPAGMTAQLDYSKRPRSIFHGTKLYNLVAPILGK